MGTGDGRLFTKWRSQMITNELSNRTPTALLCMVKMETGITNRTALRTSTIGQDSKCFLSTWTAGH